MKKKLLGVLATLGLGCGLAASSDCYYDPCFSADAPANIVINDLPDDAEVLFDGEETKSMGSSRLYTTPPLPGDRLGQYEVEIIAEVAVKGKDKGKLKKQSLVSTITVTGGRYAAVSFKDFRPPEEKKKGQDKKNQENKGKKKPNPTST